jgi:hypothetical protein
MDALMSLKGNQIKQDYISQAKEEYPSFVEEDGILFVDWSDFLKYASRFKDCFLPLYVTPTSLWAYEFGLKVGVKGNFTAGLKTPLVKGVKQDLHLFNDGEVVELPADYVVWQGLYENSTIAHDADFSDHWTKNGLDPILTFRIQTDANSGHLIGFRVERVSRKLVMQNNRIKKYGK